MDCKEDMMADAGHSEELKTEEPCLRFHFHRRRRRRDR